MFKVKGTLDNGKAFKFDAKADALHEAAVELQQKLERIAPDAQIERASFFAKGATEPELELSDVVKRERKPSANGGGKRGGRKRGGKRTSASE